jgi:methyltransferase (TIGR00027 family)
MMPGQPSQTLLRSAIRRAQHQLLDSPVILYDPVALQLVPEAFESGILSDFGQDNETMPTLLRALFAMRHRFAEDRLADAAGRDVRQYVMIGAGLDTFPWRQPEFARGMRIFAADHPASLTWVHRRLRERDVSPPPNLTHVPADLEQKQLGHQLAACGFNLESAAFCSVLGVTQYLSGEAFDALLRFAVALKPGSEIVLSFAMVDDELKGQDRDAAKRSVTRTEGLGEPWKSRFRPSQLVDQIARLGFRDVFHLTPELAQESYFTGRHDNLRAPYWEQLIAAIV